MLDATGSLCGISALYWALFDTVKTKSELLNMNYDEMRETIFTELKINPGFIVNLYNALNFSFFYHSLNICTIIMVISLFTDESMSDKDLLQQFHTCKFLTKNHLIKI